MPVEYAGKLWSRFVNGNEFGFGGKISFGQKLSFLPSVVVGALAFSDILFILLIDSYQTRCSQESILIRKHFC